MRWIGLPAVVAAALVVGAAGAPRAQDAGQTLGSLKGLRPPAPSAADYDRLVKDKGWLTILGKALFWDTQVGSRGEACASCHFHAGADPRTVNQLSPGLLVQPNADKTFGGSSSGLTKSGAKAGPNHALAAADFPFHALADVTNRESTVTYDTNDVVSSAGVFDAGFISPKNKVRVRGQLTDLCDSTLLDEVFHIDAGGKSLDTRKVAPRNSPSVINAAFYLRNFWDGRASNTFNGVDVFGRRDILKNPAARIIVADATGRPAPQTLELANSSLASQALGPPRSSFEMACAGRTFADVGRRLLASRALAKQKVAGTDGVLGSRGPKGSQMAVGGSGLNGQYTKLVENAFQPALWSATGKWRLEADGALAADLANGYTQKELNFSLFFGLAIDAYERTLISDDSPFDRHMDGAAGALSAAQLRGQALFEGKGKCAACHGGPVLSAAASFAGAPTPGPIERMPMGVGQEAALYDTGFYNIGVRPAAEDVGVANTDPYGTTLSYTRQFTANLPKTTNIPPDGFSVDPCGFEVPFTSSNCTQVPSSADGLRVAVDGAFKTPSLRNVALTPPYFHNGGEKNLADVVSFYNRGGNRRATGTKGDTTGLVAGESNVAPEIVNLKLSTAEQADLVEFLKGLTDRRVACHAAPFDHPSLPVPVGHTAMDANGDGNADDIMRQLPEVGAGGYASTACDPNTGDLFTANVVKRMLK